MANGKDDFNDMLKALGLDYPSLMEASERLDIVPGNFQPADIKELKIKLWQQEQLIRQLTSNPTGRVTILGINPAKDEKLATAIYYCDGKELEVPVPDGKVIKPGDKVKISLKTHQIIDCVESTAYGPTGSIRQIIDEERCSVDWQGIVRVVLAGKFTRNLEIGDKVILDSSGVIVLGKIGHEEESYQFDGNTNVTWNDIGGLEDAKRELREAIELPLLYPDLFKFHNQDPIKGVLLYGPPGCGKTMLVKAVVNSIKEKREKDGDTRIGVIYVKGPEVLDKFVGVAEGKIRQIFYIARKNKAMIFIDEAESLLNKRGSGQSSDVERTIVPAVLAEMDGLAISEITVLLATNRPDLLDPAITRDGRVDRKIRVPRPDINTAKIIFNLYLKKVPFKKGLALGEAVEAAASELFSGKYGLYEFDRVRDGKVSQKRFLLGDLASGAMIKGIVSKANSLALWRNKECLDKLAEKEKKSFKYEGMSKDDIEKTVARTLKENWDLNHDDELEDFIRDFKKEIPPGGFRKLKQATV